MTNQALPEAIRRQVEEAEALERQLYGTPAPEGNTEPTEVTDPAPAEPTPVETPVVQPEPVERKQDEETYKQRYDVLRGKYDVEIPRLHAQLREATTQLSQAVEEIKHLREQAQAKPQQPSVPESDNDAETFGEDLTEMVDRRVERLAKKLAQEQAAPLVEHIKQLESRLGQVNEQVADTAQDRFLNQLASKVPDYEAVNADQGFLNWLGEIDPVYGVPRQVALDAAGSRLDAERVASIFQAYKMLTGQQQQSAKRQQTRQELERQVAPNAPRSSAGNDAPTGKIWTRADYEQAYDPRVHRQVGAVEAEKLMAEADKAYAEGRVRW